LLAGLVVMVPRGGIEPPTRGFSILIVAPRTTQYIDFIDFLFCDIVTNTCHKTKNRLTKKLFFYYLSLG
jgi:hypothetical protein